jgi:quercetin dioxygenase-like cupin family protein
VKITSLDKVHKVKVEMEGAMNAFKQVPISKDDGSPNFSVRVFTVEPDGYTPFHNHPFEHLNYIIDGEGVVVTGSGEEKPIGKGDFVLVLPGETHQYRNRSVDKPLLLICGVPKEYE